MKKRAPDFVRAQRVADALGMHVRTVRKHVRSGLWLGRRVGNRYYVLRSQYDALRDIQKGKPPRTE